MTDSEILKVPFDRDAITVWGRVDARRQNWPVVYTINNSREIYVGETTNLELRVRQHLATAAKQHLKEVSVILDDSFNKSVCLDLESHLIRYFAADDKYTVLNGNSGISDSDYYQREEYRESFDQIFEKLVADGTLTRSIPDLVNSDLFKYSPFKALNTDQSVAVSELLELLWNAQTTGTKTQAVEQGDPGTGKTIIAIYLQKLISDIARSEPGEALDIDSIFADYFVEGYREIFSTMSVAFVIPQSSLRTSVKKVFRKTPGLSEKNVFGPFELAESPEYFDLVIVDEAHRLQQRANQASASLNIKFAKINAELFGEDDTSFTQLDWVVHKSHNQIFLLDSAQSIKPADLPLKTIKTVISQSQSTDTYFRLSSQMRVNGGEDYIQYVSEIMSSTPPVQAKSFGSYEFELFTNFADMRAAIFEKNRVHGLSRIVAGYAWNWASKKDKSRTDISLDGVDMQWNQTVVDWVNSPNSLHEVGSIHTIQGYDLNYAGVIIGADLGWDPSENKLVFHRDNYFDTKGKENNPTLGRKYSDEDLLDYVTNIYRVLLTRGIKGTFVYVVDSALREHLRQFLNVHR